MYEGGFRQSDSPNMQNSKKLLRLNLESKNEGPQSKGDLKTKIYPNPKKEIKIYEGKSQSYYLF